MLKLSKHSALTIKELDDVSKVHAVRENDVAVVFEQSKCQKQHKVARRHVLGTPDALPHSKHVGIQQLALEIQQEPPVAEVKVRVVTVSVHQVVHLRVENLNQRAHVRKVHVHGAAIRKVLNHPLHQPAEAAVAERLVVENDQQRSEQIAHSLHVANVQVLVDVAAKTTTHVIIHDNHDN
jgi:hypothetical protein